MSNSRYREYHMLIDEIIGPTAWLLEADEIEAIKEVIHGAIERCMELRNPSIDSE